MKEVGPIYGEDYEKDYGVTGYEGKTVLDIGADHGSTAYYFLKKGAKKVIAVEGNADLFKKLLENTSSDNRVIPIQLWINNLSHFKELITKYKPDVTKVDCEGCEVHLLKVETETLRICPEYVIESHDWHPNCPPTYVPGDLIKLTEKFEEAGFSLISRKRPSSHGIVTRHYDVVRICLWRRA